MVTFLYRIYEVKERSDEEIAQRCNEIWGMASYSKVFNEEVCENIYSCENREIFKEYIRDIYGKDIPFKASKKLEPGRYYCVILGECYNEEDYFNLVEYECSCCKCKIKTRHYRPLKLPNFDIKNHLYNIEEYKEKTFCSNKCLHDYLEKEKNRLKLERGSELNESLWISQDMFTNNDIAGYIYRITKKSTGEFYVGQTCHIPIFRWGQHLKTCRFPTEHIDDYVFEVLEIVPKGKNILEVEKEYIQEAYKKDPDKSLNISNTKNIDYREKLWE